MGCRQADRVDSVYAGSSRQSLASTASCDKRCLASLSRNESRHRQRTRRPGDPKRLAAAYLGSDASVVTVPGQRTIEAKVIVADGDEKDRIDAALAAMEDFPDA